MWLALPSERERLSKRPRIRSPAPKSPYQLFAPTEQLADMDAGRAGNLGDDRVWFKTRSDKALFIFA